MSSENINRKIHIYINGKEVVNSLSGVTREISKTKAELRSLNKNQDDYDEKVKQLTKHLADLNGRQEDFRDELKLNNKELGAARENFSNLFGGLLSGDMQAVRTGLKGVKSSIIETTKAGFAFLATPFGAIAAGIAGVGFAIKSVVDYNESIKETNKLLDNLGVSEQARADIQALAETYKVEFKSIADAVDNMVDLGLVKDEFEALDNIKAGLLKAPDKNEFLNMLNQNGVAAKNLGLTLQDVISLNQSFEATGGNAQAIFGALQKSSSTLILQSPQLKKSLESAFGSAFTNDLLTKVKSGALTYYQALDLIYKKGEELGISQRKQAQIAKDLFGKSSIAAGGYEMILKNVNAAQNKQAEGLTELQKQTDALVKSETELQRARDRALRVDWWEKFKNNFQIGLNNLIRDWYKFIEIVTTSSEERKKIRALERQQILDDQTSSVFKNWFEKQLEQKKKMLGDSYDFQEFKEQKLAQIREVIAKADAVNDEKKSHRMRIFYKTLQEFQEKVPNAAAGGELTDEEKKAQADAEAKRKKQLEDARKHAEDLHKIEQDLQQKILETNAQANELKLGLMDEGYQKELALLNAEYDEKIAKAKEAAAREQYEINKLRAALSGNGLSKTDRDSYERQLADRLEIQKNYNSQSVSLEQTRQIKIGSLQEKYINIAFQKEQERAARELQNLKTKQNFELAGITSLEKAKQVLSETMSADELRKITTFEQAKKSLKEKNLKEQYDLEVKNLERLIALYNEQLLGNFSVGFQTLSPEEREAVLKYLDDAKEKLSEIKALNSGTDSADPEKKSFSGVDLLGFDAAQWEQAFAHLDNYSEKLNAIGMVAGALQNAFSTYFKYIEASENAQMRSYERNINKKKAFLKDQLDKGLISQETYNSKVGKLEADVARKKAELEYKQAKRQKEMALVEAIVNTSIGIMKAFATLGPIFGPVAAAMIGALGSLQIATIAAQPLPSKDGFKIGGFTGDGSPNDVAGPVHRREYVIPENVLFSNDPVVPNIVGYLESKRQGRAAKLTQNNADEPQTESSFNVRPASPSTDPETISILRRLADILDRIEKYGIRAIFKNDLLTAKKIEEKIQEYKDLKSKAKQ